MGVLGYLDLEGYLRKVNGEVTGRIVTDGKDRYYSRHYAVSEVSDTQIGISSNHGKEITILPKKFPLDESLVAFWGLYSGDGAKGMESSKDPSKVMPMISLSQREPHLVAYAVEQFRNLFGDQVSFCFQIGEDSAYFMAGEGRGLLEEYYEGRIPDPRTLSEVHAVVSAMDQQYLSERRPNHLNNEDGLAFHYQHMEAMKKILCKKKEEELARVGVRLSPHDKVQASLRRPFKKGARQPGGSSRSDELAISGVGGFGELFLKIMHEMEASLYEDTVSSPSGLIVWNDRPSEVGEVIDIEKFFGSSPYAQINGKRACVRKEGALLWGQWPRGTSYMLKPRLRVDPLWCYVAGLYLAEGSTPKSELFQMYYGENSHFSFGFTSTENMSIELLLRSMKKLFLPEDCLSSWKIKVGSQYFPELVVIGLKSGVPLLRGGKSGDGKLRTMEVSLSVKQWGLQVAPCLLEYEDKFSHVEPTGAGIPRIDFSASSSVCRWYFPLLMYAVFGQEFPNPDWKE